jgi:alkylation response protein AidB-like acyl-CoA dehydrogenase
VIVEDQIVAARVADMATTIETCRSIVYQAAQAIDNGPTTPRRSPRRPSGMVRGRSSTWHERRWNSTEGPE